MRNPVVKSDVKNVHFDTYAYVSSWSYFWWFDIIAAMSMCRGSYLCKFHSNWTSGSQDMGKMDQTDTKQYLTIASHLELQIQLWNHLGTQEREGYIAMWLDLKKCQVDTYAYVSTSCHFLGIGLIAAKCMWLGSHTCVYMPIWTNGSKDMPNLVWLTQFSMSNIASNRKLQIKVWRRI